jgi:hypothetical protein
MKIYTLYTNSHKTLLTNFFLPSLFKYENCDVIVEYHPQECSGGEYMSTNWNLTMEKKIKLILRGIEENQNKIFIHSDCDISFFDSFIDNELDKLEEYDLLCQKDHIDDLCAGFMFIKSNHKTYKLFLDILHNLHSFKNDQYALNYYIKNHNTTYNICYNFLDYSYYNLYFSSLKNQSLKWNPYTEPLPLIPKNIKMFHANWIVGVDKKIKTMELISNHYK